MPLSLAPDIESRLRTVAAGRGQAPEQALESFLRPALAEAEAEMQEKEREETLAGLSSSAAEFAAGRWVSPEELDAMLRDRRR